MYLILIRQRIIGASNVGELRRDVKEIRKALISVTYLANLVYLDLIASKRSSIQIPARDKLPSVLEFA